jgi:peptidoglycan/LPS O-acetylase OafA/YrhL
VGVQVLIAHRNARLLKAHFDQYRWVFFFVVLSLYFIGMIWLEKKLEHRFVFF